MTRIELRTMIRELYFYFRLKEPANSDQIDAWAKDLQYINQKAVDFIKAAAASMERLTGAILKLSRLERRELLPERLDMNAIVRETLKG